MQSKHRLNSVQLVPIMAGMVLLLLSTASAQVGLGWNATYFGSSLVQSYSLVDASTFGTTDICSAISMALTAYPIAFANGIVVDARAMNPTGSVNCGSNPWAVTTNLPNVVLLPSGIINISATWILPADTHVIGEGPNTTTIMASTGLGDMLDMGTESGGTCLRSAGSYNCPAVVIEHLGLNGNNLATNGINNCCSQELSRVNDVFIQKVSGKGLWLSDFFDENSGPYMNITMSSVGQCVVLNIPQTQTNIQAGTRGIHGLNCNTISTSAPAIDVETPNNTLEDIQISGSSSIDGIVLGMTGAAQGNILSNIHGKSLKNLIHISGGSAPAKLNCPAGNSFACDVTVFAATAGANVTNTLEDDLTMPSTIIPMTEEANVGMYVVGEPVSGEPSGQLATIGYTRLTTSPSATTWFVGPNTPTGSSCVTGDLFSTTSTTSATTLWECEAVTGGTTWTPVK
jgi:hypothetical protein